MKKILHIQVLPKLSGVQKISLEIFKALPNDKYEKWILFSDTSDVGSRDDCVAAFEAAGAKVIFSKHLKRAIGFADWAATREIYQLCKRERFDIVHTHSTKPGIIGRIAATLARVPLVIHTVHGLAFHHFVHFPLWQFYWACEMFASCFCHRIVLVNKYYTRYFKWFRKKIVTIYNGVDFSNFPLEIKNWNQQPKILFVGRLDKPKDPITLLKAILILTHKYPQIQCTLVGDGEYYVDCQEFIRENHLEDNVTLAGWQSNPAAFYASHDIFFAPSIYESFGLMFVEAGYYYLPTVSTNVEGIPEVIQDAVTGYLAAPRNPQQMAQLLSKFMGHPELVREMGCAAHERVTVLFSSANMTEQYEKLYQQ